MDEQVWIRGFVGVALCLLCSCAPTDSGKDAVPSSRPRVLDGGGPSIELVGLLLPEDSARSNGFHFFISKYEITNRQYQAFVSESGYSGADHPSSKGSEPFLHHFTDGRSPEGQGEYPACYLNWWHCKAYCDWLSRRTGNTVRLPTEEEWMFAAAGVEHRKYPWGNVWDPKRCNWAGTEDGFAEAAPVGSFPDGCTPEGVHDLAGNIWEWCEDRVLRGGPWCLDPESVTTSCAAKEDTNRADDKFGFRIVVLD